MMRNKKGKYITKEGDKGNKGASVKKIEGTGNWKYTEIGEQGQMKEEEGEEDEIKTRIRITLREKLLHQISIEQEGMGSQPTSRVPSTPEAQAVCCQTDSDPHGGMF